ncbi:MAG TPA: hypothetical protein VFB58_16730 [Chloroflexota bacterium]|nr:hypothetical protein [Chloroflexota bacterium]
MPRVHAGDRGSANLVGWALAALLMLLLIAQAFKGIDPQDEGQFLTYPWLMALGRVPYRDIWMSYPPATYALMVPFMKLGLPGLATERTLGILLRVFYILLVNRLVAGSWRRFSPVAFAATFSLVYLASDAKLYPWIVALPLPVLGLIVLRDRPYGAALLFFAGGLFRFEFAVAGLVALLAAALLGPHSRARYLAAAGVVAAASVLFYAGLDVWTAGAAFRDIFVDQIVTVQRGRYIPLADVYLPFLALVFPVFAATVVLPLGVFIAGLRGGRRWMTASSAGVLVLLPHTLQRFDTSHVFSTAALVIPWGLIMLTRLRRGEPAAAGMRLTRAVTGGVAVVTVWATALALAFAVYLSPLSPWGPEPASHLTQLIVTGKQTIIADDVEEARGDRAVVAYLGRHAAPGDSLLILPASLASNYTRTDLYFVIGLHPAGRYLEVQPGLERQASVQREMIRTLRHTTWVLLLRGGRWYGPSRGEPETAVDRYDPRHFRPVLRTPIYELVHRR